MIPPDIYEKIKERRKKDEKTFTLDEMEDDPPPPPDPSPGPEHYDYYCC